MARVEITFAADLPPEITDEQAELIESWIKLQIDFQNALARGVGYTLMGVAPPVYAPPMQGWS